MVYISPPQTSRSGKTIPRNVTDELSAVPPGLCRSTVVETMPSANPMFMGNAVDDRKRAEPAMRQSVFEIAHEIRNPLASIKGVADAFLQRGQLTTQEREWMEVVRREVGKIDMRMRELLDVTHTRVFSFRQSSLNDLIGRVVRLATHVINQRSITIEFVDATTEPLFLYVDPVRLEDAVLNLVLNAIESIEGEGRVKVQLRCVTKNYNSHQLHHALIEVSDTGCGIPHENRRRIFEPLFTTKPEGTGLGLAVVRRTVTAYGGRISFKSKVGRGSKFVFTLPLRSQHHPAEKPD